MVQVRSVAIAGRGGLPDDPRQPLMGDRVWLDDRSQGQPQISTIAPQAPKEIVEAQGWIRDQNERIILVAAHPSRLSQAAQFLSCSLLPTGKP